MISQRDVAKKAKVSSASVSRYINDPNSVSEEIGKRVNAAIELLGYRVDYSAQVLKTGKFKRISIICPRKGSYYTELISYIEDILSEKGYFVNLYFTRKLSGNSNQKIDIIKNKQSDGFIIFPRLQQEDDELIEELMKHNDKFIIVDRVYTTDDIYQININNYEAGRKAAEMFITNNHLKPLFIWGLHDLSASHERFRGFKDVYLAQGIELSAERQINGEYSPDVTYHRTKEMQSKLPEFDCVFASNDLSALGFMKAMQEFGRSAPKEYSIIGFDNELFTSFIPVTLTTFQQPIRSIASACANMILDLVDNKEVPTKNVTLDTKMIVRDSL